MISDLKPQIRALRFLLHKFYFAIEMKTTNPDLYWNTLYHLYIYSASFLFISCMKRGVFPEEDLKEFDDNVDEKEEEGQEGWVHIWQKEITSLGKWYYETEQPLNPKQELFLDCIIEIAENHAKYDVAYACFEKHYGVYLLHVWGLGTPIFSSQGETKEIAGMYFTEGETNLDTSNPLLRLWANYIYLAGCIKKIQTIRKQEEWKNNPDFVTAFLDEEEDLYYSAKDTDIELKKYLGQPEDPVGELGNTLQTLQFN